jgi:hypothetical protein
VSNVLWPNEAAPGLAPFRLDVPDAWTAIEPPDALIAFLGPERDGFRPNLVVFGQRLASAVTVGEVAERAAGDGGVVVEREERPAGELPAAIRRSAEVARGLEIHHLVVATDAGDASPAGLRSVYTLVGTCQATHLPEDQPVLEKMISSFTVRVPATAE